MLTRDESVDRIKRALALRPFWNKLGARNAAPCNIVAVGSSVTEGYPVSGLLTDQNWTTVLGQRLRAAYPQAVAGSKTGYYSVFRNASTPSDYPVVAGGATKSLNYSNGLGGKSYLATGAGSDGVICTFTAPTGTTAVDLVWVRAAAAGQFSWAINGGAATNVSTQGTDAPWMTTRIAAVAGDVVTIRYVSGAGFFAGFFAYDGDETSGVRMYNAGCSSRGLWTLNTTPAIWGCFTSSNINPALVIVESGPSATHTTAAAWKTVLEASIALLQTNCPTASILIWTPYPWNSGLAPQSEYAAIADQVAATADNICHVDFSQVIVRTSLTDYAGGLLPDNTHPGVAGSDITASLMFDAISPRRVA